MSNTKNIYIRSLEVGVENIEAGISYFEMKDKLINEGFPFSGTFEEYFINWFFKNFFEHSQYPYYHGTRYGDNYRKLKDISDQSKNTKCIISSEACFDLIDYQELIEVKKSSKQSNRNALIAIVLTLLALLVSIISNIFCC